jgi:hypothetical protein
MLALDVLCLCVFVCRSSCNKLPAATLLVMLTVFLICLNNVPGMSVVMKCLPAAHVSTGLSIMQVRLNLLLLWLPHRTTVGAWRVLFAAEWGGVNGAFGVALVGGR